MNRCENILFYTIDPADQYSPAILNELKKNHLLDSQFIKLCVNNPNLRLPRLIEELDTFPLIVTKAIRKPIFGKDALTWIQEGAFSGRAGEIEGKSLDFGDLEVGSKLSEAFGKIIDEYAKGSHHLHHNTNYNLGIDNSTRSANSRFSGTKDDPQMMHTEEEDEKQARSKTLLERKLKQVSLERKRDLPDHQHQTGGGYLSRGSIMNSQMHTAQLAKRGGYDPRLGNGLDPRSHPFPSRQPTQPDFSRPIGPGTGHSSSFPTHFRSNNHLRSGGQNPYLEANGGYSQPPTTFFPTMDGRGRKEKRNIDPLAASGYPMEYNRPMSTRDGSHRGQSIRSGLPSGQVPQMGPSNGIYQNWKT